MSNDMLRQMTTVTNQDTSRAETLFYSQKDHTYRQTDRLFAWLMLFQWVVCIVTALWISPRSWEGVQSSVHIHVWAAVLLGGAITSFPVYMALRHPGKLMTRQIIAVSQMLMSALLIHLSGGRIETHFHVFGSLAFLAFYRDWRVLITASLVVAFDHGLRGLLWPQSVYGVLAVEPWRWVEHTGWVVFEDIFLIISIRQSEKEMRDIAYRQAQLESTNELIEAKVTERTSELEGEIAHRKEAEAQLSDRARELDLTVVELASLSKDLEQSRDQAVRASRFKSEFLANMSHEIRTPLNAVIGMSDLMMRTNLALEQREYAEIINNSADALLGLVNDILDYSKIEAGKLDLEIIDFEIVDLVESAADLVSENARSKELLLSTFIDPAIPRFLRGDPARIRQVLLNLLSNSIKFTDAGEIVIRAELLESRGVKVKLSFSVSDTGIGISGSSRERLFHPFTQADASTTRKYGGTGLGLAISKRLVELMNGAIDFDSTYGKGAVFGFTLEVELSCNVIGGNLTIPHIASSRVLLLARESGTQQVLQSYLNLWNVRTSTASDTTKATWMLNEQVRNNDPYSLVIVLFEEGTHLGYFAHELRNASLLSKTKLVVIGNALDREFGQRLLQKGYSAYLQTPVRQSRLFECLRSLLQETEEETRPHEAATPAHGTADRLPEPQPCNLILVVEDNRVNQKVALLLLRELGFAAHAVSNGLEALDAVSRTQYALILMDCQMPEMDGFQATNEIRTREALTGTRSPIVAMTAHAMSGDRMKCLAAGMDDYLSKPVTQEQLAVVLDRWLHRDPRTSESTAIKDERKSEDVQSRPIELELLRNTFGEKASEEVVKQFLALADTQIRELSSALRANDITSIRQITQALKRESATFYATELAELCRTLEELALAGFTPAITESCVNSINLAWTRLKSACQVA